MDKEAALQDYKEKYISEQWQEEFVAIDERYGKDRDGIENGLISAFESLCRNALRLQKQGAKGDIAYIYISFLRTSIMENTSFYRLDAYDKDWFLDDAECFSLWDADFIFCSLFQHMNALETKKTGYAGRITSMDIDAIKLKEALKYHILAVEFIRSMVPRLVETAAFKEMGKDPDLCILAGEYMDYSEVLYGKNKNIDRKL